MIFLDDGGVSSWWICSDLTGDGVVVVVVVVVGMALTDRSDGVDEYLGPQAESSRVGRE